MSMKREAGMYAFEKAIVDELPLIIVAFAGDATLTGRLKRGQKSHSLLQKLYQCNFQGN